MGDRSRENESGLDDSDSSSGRGGLFPTTHWTVVAHAADAESSQWQSAMGSFYSTYRPAIGTFLRSKGFPSQGTDDLIQRFFAEHIGKEHLRSIDRNRGSFRAFLFTVLKRFVIKIWREQSAQKRPDLKAEVPWDEVPEELLGKGEDPARMLALSREFDREWAENLLSRVRKKLVDEFARKGRAEQFIKLKPFLVDSYNNEQIRELAEDLNMSEAAIKSEIHRMRQRWSAILRQEVGRTLGPLDDVDSEIRYLIEIVAFGKVAPLDSAHSS